MVRVVVDFEYDAEQPDELTIRKGDIITNVKKQEGGWWEGTLNGKTGVFPDNFVKEIPDDPPKKSVVPTGAPLLPAPTAAPASAAPVAAVSIDNKLEPKFSQPSAIAGKGNINVKALAPGAQPPLMGRKPASKSKRARVTFAYVPEQPDEVELRIGDIVEILKQEEEGWWEGVVNGKEGVFPSNFVEIIDDLNDNIEPDAPSNATEAAARKPTGGGMGYGDIFKGGQIQLKPSKDNPTKAPAAGRDFASSGSVQPPPGPAAGLRGLAPAQSQVPSAAAAHSRSGSAGTVLAEPPTAGVGATKKKAAFRSSAASVTFTKRPGTTPTAAAAGATITAKPMQPPTQATTSLAAVAQAAARAALARQQQRSAAAAAAAARPGGEAVSGPSNVAAAATAAADAQAGSRMPPWAGSGSSSRRPSATNPPGSGSVAQQSLQAPQWQASMRSRNATAASKALRINPSKLNATSTGPKRAPGGPAPALAVATSASSNRNVGGGCARQGPASSDRTKCSAPAATRSLLQQPLPQTSGGVAPTALPAMTSSECLAHLEVVEMLAKLMAEQGPAQASRVQAPNSKVTGEREAADRTLATADVQLPTHCATDGGSGSSDIFGKAATAPCSSVVKETVAPVLSEPGRSSMVPMQRQDRSLTGAEQGNPSAPLSAEHSCGITATTDDTLSKLEDGLLSLDSADARNQSSHHNVKTLDSSASTPSSSCDMQRGSRVSGEAVGAAASAGNGAAADTAGNGADSQLPSAGNQGAGVPPLSGPSTSALVPSHARGTKSRSASGKKTRSASRTAKQRRKREKKRVRALAAIGTAARVTAGSDGAATATVRGSATLQASMAEDEQWRSVSTLQIVAGSATDQCVSESAVDTASHSRDQAAAAPTSGLSERQHAVSAADAAWGARPVGLGRAEAAAQAGLSGAPVADKSVECLLLTSGDRPAGIRSRCAPTQGQPAGAAGSGPSPQLFERLPLDHTDASPPEVEVGLVAVRSHCPGYGHDNRGEAEVNLEDCHRIPGTASTDSCLHLEDPLLITTNADAPDVKHAHLPAFDRHSSPSVTPSTATVHELAEATGDDRNIRADASGSEQKLGGSATESDSRVHDDCSVPSRLVMADLDLEADMDLASAGAGSACTSTEAAPYLGGYADQPEAVCFTSWKMAADLKAKQASLATAAECDHREKRDADAPATSRKRLLAWQQWSAQQSKHGRSRVFSLPGEPSLPGTSRSLCRDGSPSKCVSFAKGTRFVDDDTGRTRVVYCAGKLTGRDDGENLGADPMPGRGGTTGAAARGEIYCRPPNGAGNVDVDSSSQQQLTHLSNRHILGASDIPAGARLHFLQHDAKGQEAVDAGPSRRGMHIGSSAPNFTSREPAAVVAARPNLSCSTAGQPSYPGSPKHRAATLPHPAQDDAEPVVAFGASKRSPSPKRTKDRKSLKQKILQLFKRHRRRSKKSRTDERPSNHGGNVLVALGQPPCDGTTPPSSCPSYPSSAAGTSFKLYSYCSPTAIDMATNKHSSPKRSCAAAGIASSVILHQAADDSSNSSAACLASDAARRELSHVRPFADAVKSTISEPTPAPPSYGGTVMVERRQSSSAEVHCLQLASSSSSGSLVDEAAGLECVADTLVQLAVELTCATTPSARTSGTVVDLHGDVTSCTLDANGNNANDNNSSCHTPTPEDGAWLEVGCCCCTSSRHSVSNRLASQPTTHRTSEAWNTNSTKCPVTGERGESPALTPATYLPAVMRRGSLHGSYLRLQLLHRRFNIMCRD